MDMEIETNNSRGGQIGNQNAKKGKLFYDRIRMDLLQDPRKLANIVGKLISLAEAGEAWAVKEVMDRVDGKAIATQEVTGPNGAELKTGVQITFVDPDGNVTTD
jgi:hypothetical protein